MWSLPAVGRELSCSEGVCRFVSLIFHVLRMKTGWESGAVAALFVLHSVTISEKKGVAFHVGCDYQWWLRLRFAAASEAGPVLLPPLYLWYSAHTLATHLFLLQLNINPAKIS